MNRLFRLTLLLVLFVGLAGVLSRQLGLVQRPSIIAAMFTNPDGSPCRMPCMFGLIPGRTGLIDAAAIFNTHPVLTALDRAHDNPPGGQIVHFWDQNQRISIYFTPDNVLESVSWGTNTCSPSWLPSIGDVMAIWGTPSSAVATRGGSLVAETWYMYSNYDLLIQSNRGASVELCQFEPDSGRLDLHDVIVTMDVSNHEALSRMSRYWRPWAGFRPARFYATP